MHHMTDWLRAYWPWLLAAVPFVDFVLGLIPPDKFAPNSTLHVLLVGARQVLRLPVAIVRLVLAARVPAVAAVEADAERKVSDAIAGEIEAKRNLPVDGAKLLVLVAFGLACMGCKGDWRERAAKDADAFNAAVAATTAAGGDLLRADVECLKQEGGAALREAAESALTILVDVIVRSAVTGSVQPPDGPAIEAAARQLATGHGVALVLCMSDAAPKVLCAAEGVPPGVCEASRWVASQTARWLAPIVRAIVGTGAR